MKSDSLNSNILRGPLARLLTDNKPERFSAVEVIEKLFETDCLICTNFDRNPIFFLESSRFIFSTRWFCCLRELLPVIWLF